MPELKEPLSERELEILRLVATGAPNKEIARQLVISPNTVKVHLRNIFTKIGVASRTEATLYAVNCGLVKSGADEARLEEASEEEGSETPAQQAAPLAASEATAGQSQPRKTWQAALLVALFALLLLGAWMVGARLLTPPAALLAVATRTSAPVQVQTRWSANPALPTPRKGMGFALYENTLYLFGGESAQGVEDAVLRYDLIEKNWKNLASKPTPVSDVQAVLLGEKIYLPGGCLANGGATDRLEVYDPRQDNWESLAALPAPRCAYALASFEGRLYLFGGKDQQNYFTTVYVYDPQEDQWNERSPLESPRAYASAVVVGGKIHVIGGFDGTQALDLNQAYLPTRDGNGESPWESFAPLPQPRYAMGVTQLVNVIYLLGGSGEASQPGAASALQYHVQVDEWMAFDEPPLAVGELPALLAYGNFLYALGGETSAGLSAANQSYQAIYTIAVPMLQNEE